MTCIARSLTAAPIVLVEALTLKNGRYYYQDKLYNGACLHAENGVVTAKHVIEQGLVVGEYHTPFKEPNDLYLLDTVASVHEDAQVFYQGQPVTATIFEIGEPENTICAEYTFENGFQSVESLARYFNDLITYNEIQLSSPHLVQYFMWRVIDELTTWNIITGDNIPKEKRGGVNLDFAPQGKLRKARLSRYYKSVLDYTDEFHLPIIHTLEDINRFEKLEDFRVDLCYLADCLMESTLVEIAKWQPKNITVWQMNNNIVELVLKQRFDGLHTLTIFDLVDLTLSELLHLRDALNPTLTIKYKGTLY